MNVAKLELCEELFKLSSGWIGTEYSWVRFGGNDPEVVRDFDPNADNFRWCLPAYDLGYLMRKLPERSIKIEDTAMLGRNTNNTGWSVVYRDLVCIEETPEDAVCKLLIRLFHQGILKREENKQ